MKSGELRHTVAVQRPTSIVDTAGDNVTSWATVETVKARVRDLSVRESFMSETRRGEALREVTFRYRPSLAAIDHSWRLVKITSDTARDTAGEPIADSSNVFAFDGPPVNVDERNREFRAICSQGLRTE